MACERNSVTITWRIENYDFYCEKSGYWIFSPPFIIGMQKDTTWIFRIVAHSTKREGYFVFDVDRRPDSAKDLELDVEIAFFKGNDSSPVYEERYTHTYRSCNETLQCYVPQKDVYNGKGDEFRKPKILTIRCRMQKRSGSFSEESRCFARTTIRLEKSAFVGIAQKFSYLTPGEKKSLTVKSTSIDQLFSAKLYFGDDVCCKDKLWIEIVSMKKDYVKFCKCKLFLLDSEGTKTECGRKEILFIDSMTQEWKFPLNVTTRYLMARKMKFLSNDTLTIKCEFVYSTGIEYERIEDSEFGNFVSINKKPELTSALKDFTRLYKEGILCDMKLQTETETFNAHKSILSARSSVFQTMFTTDMKEKMSDCIKIEDLDADTVHRMLIYLYSDNLEDLDCDRAKSLYFAADKYNIETLKHRCSEILKSQIQLPNCCDLLLLSDRHQDEDLKKSVQDYIVLYRDEVLHTEQWANLERSHPLLAIGVFRSICLEK